MSNKTRVLITGALHETAIHSFQSNPKLQIAYHPDCDRETLLTQTRDAHVLVTRSETDVNREVLDAGTQLKVVARAAVGVGNIDISYATEKGILVINCPGKNTNSAAELTLGLLLSMFRNIPQAHATVKAGGWDRHRFTGRELRGKQRKRSERCGGEQPAEQVAGEFAADDRCCESRNGAGEQRRPESEVIHGRHGRPGWGKYAALSTKRSRW